MLACTSGTDGVTATASSSARSRDRRAGSACGRARGSAQSQLRALAPIPLKTSSCSDVDERRRHAGRSPPPSFEYSFDGGEIPYYGPDPWDSTLKQLNADPGVGFVNAIHLQCYSGGQGNVDPRVIQQWQDLIASAGSAGTTVLIPGLGTVQAQPGPWWYENAIGGSVVTRQGLAMDGRADWSKHLRTLNYPNASAALQGAQSWGGATFFFYCQAPVDLGPGRQFAAGDAVFFAGAPSWRPVPQCTGYSLSGGCSNIYNVGGACPADLQQQYKAWRGIRTPPQGGFIWLYDSVVDCFLCGCCGGSEQNPATTAQAYRNAIMNGLG